MASAPPPMPELTAEQQQLYRDLQEQMKLDGSREQLKAYLKERLLEAQWKKEITAHCQGMVLERGLNNVTVDEMVLSTQAKASETLPPGIKTHMIEHIRQTLIDQAEASLAAAPPAGS